jgi:MoaA/NifB/PqqE/SkfB family radical SAM enzyme
MKYFQVKQVHFEPTQLCQASCPMCDRNKNGGEVNQHLTNASMTLEDFKKVFEPEFLKKLHTFYMCGNHGDPIFAPEMLEMCEYVREFAPHISLSITTNGGARKPEWWERLAKVVSFVNFSVDGLEDTNHLYRQGVVWENVEENMQAFIDAGGRAKWTFLIFNYNEHQVKLAEMQAKLMGVNEFIVKKSGRYVTSAALEKKDSHQAMDRKGNLTQLLSPPQNPEYKNKEIENYDEIVSKYGGSMETLVMEAPMYPKCMQKKEIYVSATGLVTPCCWMNGQLLKWWRDPKDTEEHQLIESTGGYDNINAIITPLKDVVNSYFFKEVEKSWTHKRLRICGVKCNIAFDPFKAQWQ